MVSQRYFLDGRSKWLRNRGKLGGDEFGGKMEVIQGESNRFGSLCLALLFGIKMGVGVTQWY
jgi:hypothetical protein